MSDAVARGAVELASDEAVELTSSEAAAELAEFRRGTPPITYTEKELLEALTATSGNVSAAARLLDVPSHRLRTRIIAGYARHEKAAALIAELREQLVDRAEGILGVVLGGEVVKQQVFDAAKFTLPTLGKARGYTTGVSGLGANGAIEVVIRRFGEVNGEVVEAPEPKARLNEPLEDDDG